ncbi:hypothetical protein CR513_24120, partial [Mucuna pruriens]
MPAQGNSPSLEDLMKQLSTNNLDFQQTMSSSNMQFQQNMNAIIQDLKIVSQLQLAGSSKLPSQTIPNLRGNASAVMLRSGKALPQPAMKQLSRVVDADFEPKADSQALQ